TTVAPVAGSASWPAWIARVAKPWADDSTAIEFLPCSQRNGDQKGEPERFLLVRRIRTSYLDSQLAGSHPSQRLQSCCLECAMSASDSDILLAQKIRIMQIILAALVSGASIFLVVVLFLRLSGKGPQPWPTPILTYVGIPLTAGTLLAHVLVPRQAV